jgi:3-(3-hydroxy-phenyl)propionate hydroxylase
LTGSALNTPDEDSFTGWMTPGAPADDAPCASNPGKWLLGELLAPPGTGTATGFTILLFSDAPSATQLAVLHQLEKLKPAVAAGVLPLQGLAAQRYDAQPGTAYLLRPDHHVAARWRHLDLNKVQAALARAGGLA